MCTHVLTVPAPLLFSDNALSVTGAALLLGQQIVVITDVCGEHHGVEERLNFSRCPSEGSVRRHVVGLQTVSYLQA